MPGSHDEVTGEKSGCPAEYSGQNDCNDASRPETSRDGRSAGSGAGEFGPAAVNMPTGLEVSLEGYTGDRADAVCSAPATSRERVRHLMIITIDGPAGAGKSTVARSLAARLDFEFLDTGAMYRAVAWCCLQQGIELNDADAAAEVAAGMTLQMQPDRILCNGQDVTTAIRTVEVSRAASIVAAAPGVRHEMVRLQREAARGRRMVTEGRDQGTVVFPDADCKFFLTADPRERAVRRLKDLENQGQSASLDEVLTQIIDRDDRDRRRPIGPLVKADDAVEVDTTGRSVEDILADLETQARARMAHVSARSQS